MTRFFALAGLSLGLGLAAGPASAAITPYTPDAQTAVLYHLDEATGAYSTGSYIDDSSANNLDLRSPSGDSSPFLGVAGPSGLGTAATLTTDTTRAFRFGSDDIGDNLSFDQFTIEAWVRNPSGTNPAVFYVQDSGAAQRVFFRLNQTTAGAAVQLVYNNATTGTTTLTSSTRTVLAPDAWYHVAVTYDDQGDTAAGDSVVTFYLTPETSSDRVEVGSFTGRADLKPLSGSGELLEIGGSGGNNELGGDLDEVRYSNVVRDSFNLIPEPGSLALVSLGALMLVRRRQR
jgi:hypothetical protein